MNFECRELDWILVNSHFPLLDPIFRNHFVILTLLIHRAKISFVPGICNETIGCRVLGHYF